MGTLRDRQRLSRKMVRIRSLEERACLSRAQAARRALGFARAEERSCLERAAAVGAELQRRAVSGLAGHTVSGYGCLMEAAQRSVQGARRAREQAERSEQEASLVLLGAVRERQAAEKLAERVEEEARREADRHEQRVLDEVASQSARTYAALSPV